MNELTVEWRKIEWIAILEGKSLIEIDQLRDEFFKEKNDEEIKAEDN